MTDDSDRTADSDPLFATAKQLLAATAGDDTAEQFSDAVRERMGDQNVTEAVLGGLAAGEQINQMRERSRQLQSQAARQDGPPVEPRAVEDEAGRYVGTVIYVDDPEVEWFTDDDSVLLKAPGGDTQLTIPQGVGSVEVDRTNGVLELLVRPPDYSPVANQRLLPAADATEPAECELCFQLSSNPSGPDTCVTHGDDDDVEAQPQGSDPGDAVSSGDSDGDPAPDETATDDTPETDDGE